MAKQSRRSRARRNEEPARDDIFTHFETSAPEYRGREAAEDTGGSKEPTVAELMAQIARLQGQVEVLTDRPEPAPVAAPAQTQQRPRAQDIAFSTDGLPDPLHDRAAYDQALAERIQTFVRANNEVVRSEVEGRVQQTTSAERMRREFFGAHPEWAEHDKIVGMVAAEVAEEWSPQAATMIQAKPKRYYKEVAKRLTAQYGALVADRDDEDDDDDTPYRAEPRRTERERPRGVRNHGDDGDDDGRTAGMFSGMEGGGRPTEGRRAKAEGGDMIAELHAEQRKSGFF